MIKLPNAASYLALCFCTCGSLVSCTLGPDFQRPQPPAAPNFSSRGDVGATVDAPSGRQTITRDAAPDRWWLAYGSETLNGWVVEALAANKDLKAARGALQAARERLSATVSSSVWPTVGLGGQVTRERGIGLPTLGPSTNVYSVYAASVATTYDLDLFGGVRRTNEAATAQFDSQAFELAAARQTLAANVVVLAVRSSALEAQISATSRMVAMAQQEETLTSRLHDLGALANRDALRATRQAHEIAASLPALQSQYEQSRDALAVLLGRAPIDAPEALAFDSIQLPTNIPVALPSEIVRRRPDVLAAEARLHQATADVGVATANLLPQFTLTASFGSASYSQSAFLKGSTQVWSGMAGFTQPLFQGGALRAQRRAATSELEASAARYESVVLKAFQNIADSLSALAEDARVELHRAQSEQAARSLLDETTKRRASGSRTVLEELSSERDWQRESVNRIAARAARLTDTAALFQAVGAPV